MEYTLTSAANATGSSKSKIHRMIKDGRLSARRLEDGSYRIEASELGRVFSSELTEPSHRDTVRHDGTPLEPVGTELAVLRLKVQMLEEQLGRERELRDQERETNQETVSDLRKRLDRAEERILALTYQAAPAATEKSQNEPSKPLVGRLEPPRSQRGFLGRLWGR